MSLRYKKKKIVLCFDKENKVEKYVAANVLAGSLNYNIYSPEVFNKLKELGALDDYIKTFYDTLHTQGKAYIVDS